MDQSTPEEFVKNAIHSFLADPRENTLGGDWSENAWSEPLVGFSKGSDPLYREYWEHVGPFSLTPHDAFCAAFEVPSVEAQDLVVITWVLPQTEATRLDNRREEVYPSERWARARIFGEQVNLRLQDHVTRVLRESGYRAVAPTRTALFVQRTSARYGFSSTWSERHAAYAAGLGTFGLCDGLITPAGKAVRIGSVVAEMDIPATPRPYTSHREYCLFFSKNSCGRCILRCPVGAITREGKDKDACRRHLFGTTAVHVAKIYGFEGYGCGLCQTNVPCEEMIPGVGAR